MSLGGGFFTSQNKILPGSYINFISVARASVNLSERGYATMPIELDWGKDNEIITVTQQDMIQHSKKLFGYDYTDERLKGLRDFFLGATTGYFYRLNSGEKAHNEIATAVCSGIRGNDLIICIQPNIQNEEKFDVITYLENKAVDVQTVGKAAELQANDYVEFHKEIELTATIGTPLQGGTNGVVTGECYQTYLEKIETYFFNAMGCISNDEAVKALFAAFQKRMREEVGAKFQTILYQYDKADYEGVISIENQTLDSNFPESSAVFWITGMQAGISINKSLTNKTYDGAFTIDVSHTQTQLSKGLQNGAFLFHKVGEEVRVLEDINTFTSFSKEKNEDFSMNQVIRVIDQIAIDISSLFYHNYLGKVNNDEAGRISLWNDIVTHHKELERMGAIEGFKEADVIVEKGNLKKQVIVEDTVNVTAAMSQLYMTVSIA